MIRLPLASVSVQNTIFVIRIGHVAEEPSHATSIFSLHYAPMVESSENQHLRAFPTHEGRLKQNIFLIPFLSIMHQLLKCRKVFKNAVL